MTKPSPLTHQQQTTSAGSLHSALGIAAAAWFFDPLEIALAAIAPLAELAEIYSDYNHSLLKPANRRAALRSGLRLTVHGPWENADVANPHEAARKAALVAHRRHIHAAAQVGAEVYVLHPDYSSTPIIRSNAVVEALHRSLVALERLQEEVGVRIALENMPGTQHSHFASPGDIELGAIGLALDTGHAAAGGQLDGFLRNPQARLQHVHLHDNKGPVGETVGPDDHLPLGRGVVDVSAVLTAAQAAGATTVIEVLTPEGVAESLAYLKRRG